METALYYTLSTIAQTLAGALAVLVAFALFRLANLDEAMAQGRAGLLQYANWQRHWEALVGGDVEGLRNSVGATFAPHERVVYHETYVAANQRPRVLGALRWALAATVIDITLCFIGLPVTPILTCRPILAWSTAGITVLLGIVSLGLYWRLITAMVYRPAD